MPEVRTRYGVLSVPDTETDIIGRFLHHYGEWAWDEIQFVASTLPENARVLDVGAFVGTFGLGLEKQGRLASICFVEANPALAPFLEENARRNSRIPHEVRSALVIGTSDRVSVGHAHPDNLGSTSFASDATGDCAVLPPTEKVTLAQLRLAHGPFDLIKLDTEGTEFDILQADEEFLKSGQTAVWVECNENSHSLELADLFLSWGMELFYFAFPSHNPDNFRGHESAIFPWAYEAGLLATKTGAPNLEPSLRNAHCILRPIWSAEDLKKELWQTPRWGMEDWHNQSIEHIVAMATHTFRGDQYNKFLKPGWSPGEFIWTRVDRLQAAFQSLSEEHSSLVAISDQQQHELETLGLDTTKMNNAVVELTLTKHSLEQQLADSTATALDHLSVLGMTTEALAQETEKVDNLNKAICQLEKKLDRLMLIEDQELPVMRQEIVSYELQCRQQQAELIRKQMELDLILTSATWRIARKAHSIIIRVPPLRAALLLLRRAGGKIRRSVRKTSS